MTDLNIDQSLIRELYDPMAGTGFSFAVSALHHRSAETSFHMPPPLITAILSIASLQGIEKSDCQEVGHTRS